jgi:hypothetical protein
MQHEITRLTRQKYSQINFNAQACFNRVIPNTAIQFNKKYGIQENILQIFKETLETSKCVVKIGNKVTNKLTRTKKRQNYTEQDKEAVTHHSCGHSFQGK